MSEICCDNCAYWLPDFKKCGNKTFCIDKDRFVKLKHSAYQQGRDDAITEAIATIVNTPCTWASHFPQVAQDALIDRQNEIIDILEELRGRKAEMITSFLE